MYDDVINADKLRTRIADGASAPTTARLWSTSASEHLFSDVLTAWSWHDSDTGDKTSTHRAKDVEDALTAATISFRVESSKTEEREVEKAAQFEAVKRWFEDDWIRIEPKRRTSIVEGVSVFLSLFDDNPRVKHTFCPPKETYDAASNPDRTRTPTNRGSPSS